ncbi:MAG: restriction endonuclease [Lachnospiraceae bacterium]|nr:restriction endonuclease [Lachnospiraceae bacterium]
MEQPVTLAAVSAVLVFLIFLLIGLGFWQARRLGRRFRGKALDEMEGHDFEYFCADLLRRHGFDEVEVTKASGDYGVDVLAEKDGVTYAVQCKRYDAPVGVKAVQEACAGREYYDRMVGAVMTNQYFTQPAVEAAKKLKILLWDRGYLESMMEERV